MDKIKQLLQSIWFWLLGVNDPGTIVDATEWHWYEAAPVSMAVLVILGLLGLGAIVVNVLPRSGMPWRTRLLLMFLRLAGFGLLWLLLVQLELRVTINRALPPNIVVMTDLSGSMGIKDVSMGIEDEEQQSRLAAAERFRGELRDALAEKTYLADYSFSWQARPGLDEAEPAGMTRVMGSLADVLRAERDVQAVIMLTDGNDTAGDEGAAVAPLYAARGVPVYPVMFGKPDTPFAPSVRFTGGPDYVRLGDELRLEATLTAPQFKGEIVRATLYVGDAETPLIAPQDVLIGEEPSKIVFVIKPDKPGRFVYRIVVDGLSGAPTRKLLEARHQVDVIDQKIRVLFVDIPRDERKIVGHWLARDPVVDFAGLLLLPKQGWFAQGQLRHSNTEGLPKHEGDLYEYDVIILGDIPYKLFRSGDAEETKLKWMVDFVQRRGGGLVVMGGRNVYGAGGYEKSRLAGILPFKIEGMRKPQIDKTFAMIPTDLGYSHPVMRLEREYEANKNAWLELPKIEGCNRVGPVKPGASLLAMNNTPEDGMVPAIAYNLTGKGKVLALTVDTTWRWELLRPRGSEVTGEPEGTDYFRRFWGNAVRFLAPNPRLEPELPQIARRRSNVAVGETVRLSTRLVDRLYKPIRDADLTVRVINPAGTEYRIYPSDGRSAPGLYEYEVMVDTPGIWKVTSTHHEEEVLAAIAVAEKAVAKAKADEDELAMSVASSQLESARTKIATEEIKVGDSLEELADPRSRPSAMEAFAAATGGRTFTPGELADLVSTMRLASHELSQSYAIAMWNLPAVMALLILIICIDCFVRKRRGLV